MLWAAIKAVQRRWPESVCVVYTGDQGVDKTSMLARVEVGLTLLITYRPSSDTQSQERFDIHLHAPTVMFMYLSTRRYVMSSTYPRFTLLDRDGWKHDIHLSRPTTAFRSPPTGTEYAPASTTS